MNARQDLEEKLKYGIYKLVKVVDIKNETPTESILPVLDCIAEETIRQSYEREIKSGNFRVIHKPQVGGPIWSIFARFANNKGNVLDKWVFCRKCEQVFKLNGFCLTTSLRHKCFSGLQEVVQTIKQDGIYMPGNKLLALPKWKKWKDVNAGSYKIMLSIEMGTVSWQILDMIAREDGFIVSDYVSCSKCKNLLDCNDLLLGNLSQHSCFWPLQRSLLRKRSSFRESTEVVQKDVKQKLQLGFRESIEVVQKDVEQKLQLGLYFLVENEETNNAIWQKFCFISRRDRSILTEIIWCKQCSRVLKYLGPLSLKRHRCRGQKRNPKVAETRSTINNSSSFAMDMIQKGVERKIKTGFYKLKGNAVHCTSFAHISKSNGMVFRGIVCCRQCLVVLKFIDNKTSVEKLKAHKCEERAIVNSCMRQSVKTEFETSTDFFSPIKVEVYEDPDPRPSYDEVKLETSEFVNEFVLADF
ncbi:uncharacterized protein LOC106085110 [Stomoxys calcitrans]|uniref:uncharacterized protein LOC106085110 n=1 Tax=Stomoxys calcitrans TaxID=35570 RepID=UPI0027E27637|nr:uncharacterized protein LOC106085110 [Stomoxys calcitrans]XP_013104620.2 uncharacterized protein LOC106085110 [Stomoxys calcitrans]